MTIGALLLCAIVPCAAMALSGYFSTKNYFPVKDKTAIITGGSQGLGLSVSKQLASKGANVVIVAQDKAKLEAALEQIKDAAKSPHQRFLSLSFDLRSPTSAPDILACVTQWNNNSPPSIVWCCAGHCVPGFFASTPIETLRSQMETIYWSAAYMAHAALKHWLYSPLLHSTSEPSTHQTQDPGKEQQRRTSSSTSPTSRHIIFTSSTLAFFPVAGYAPYTPAKAAMKALSDTLVQEVAMHNAQYNTTNASSTSTSSPDQVDIKIHTLFPMGILTPGYANENNLKPALTLMLEKDDRPQHPDKVARIAVEGLERGDYLITTMFLGHVMRGAGMGASVRNGRLFGLVDLVWGLIGLLAGAVVVPDFIRKCARWGRENAKTG